MAVLGIRWGTALLVKEYLCHWHTAPLLGLGVLLGISEALIPLLGMPPASQLRSLQGEGKVEKKKGGEKFPKQPARFCRAFYWMTCRSILFSLNVTKP